MKLLKQEVKKLAKLRGEFDFLNKLERRFKVACNTPGFDLSFASSDQVHALAPLSLDLVSKDLVSSEGRRIHSMREMLVHPTMAKILDSQHHHSGEAVVQTKCFQS